LNTLMLSYIKQSRNKDLGERFQKLTEQDHP
jgi:hypothetical protein